MRNGAPAGCVAAYIPRGRPRVTVRTAFARRHGRLAIARTPAELLGVLRRELVDAVIVDVVGANHDTWTVASLAREFPALPFFAVAPARPGEMATLARCATLDFVDLLAEGLDDDVLGALVRPHRFSTRFARAFRDAPPVLCLDTPIQQGAWRFVVGRAGLVVSTAAVARNLGITREHLSRSFAAGGAPNLKRVMDLVRVIAASELAKNPGYAVGDVAAILGFSSSSHLASTAQRVVGTRPRSLARLRTVDLIDRFAQGRGRSRE